MSVTANVVQSRVEIPTRDSRVQWRPQHHSNFPPETGVATRNVAIGRTHAYVRLRAYHPWRQWASGHLNQPPAGGAIMIC